MRKYLKAILFVHVVTIAMLAFDVPPRAQPDGEGLEVKEEDQVCIGRPSQARPESPMEVYGFPPPTDSEAAVQTLFAFDKGLDAQRNGEYKLAIELYTQHIEGGAYWGAKYGKEAQNLSLAYGNRAAANASIGRFQQALKDIQAARALFDDSEFHTQGEAIIFNQRGIAALMNRESEKALQDFACATFLFPQNAQLWANRCFAASLVIDATEARKFCDKALSIDPSNNDAKLVLEKLR